MGTRFGDVLGGFVNCARDARSQLATSTPPPARTGVPAIAVRTDDVVQAKQRSHSQRQTSVQLMDQTIDVPMAALSGRNATSVRTWSPPV